MTVPESFPTPIDVVGDERATLTADDIRSLDPKRRSEDVDCLSGKRYSATWGGVRVEDLFELVGVPEGATHLLVEATDGYRICVDLGTGTEGLIAFTRDGSLIADGANYGSRFVASGVDGPRTVKGVAKVEAVEIPPGTDPGEYETTSARRPD